KQINKKPLVIVDQFCSEKNYYNYLKDTKVVVDQIHFETKAEDKYLGVAVGAIIARDAFLEEMDKLSIKVGFTLQKGASNKVDMQGCDIIEKYGEDYLNKVAKIHFVNTQKIKEHMKQ
ncbi:MAG: ribonuclease HIII, partial [Erysipelotrichales bacterium]